MKKTIAFMACVFLLTACADSKTFKTGENEYLHVEPYGWADVHEVKNDSVVYRVNVGNVVWSIILIETIGVPIWLTGWQFYEPARLKYPTTEKAKGD